MKESKKKHKKKAITSISKKKGKDPENGMHKFKSTYHLAIHPRFAMNLSLGLRSHFKKMVGTYVPQFSGILAGHGKFTVKGPLGAIGDDGSAIHLDVKSKFTVFRPTVGQRLSGVVNKKSPNHVSCLVNDLFNVTCFKPHNVLARDWSGSKVALSEIVHFKITKVETDKSIPIFLGELLEAES